MELYLVRHLATNWNKSNQLQGSKDIPISPISQCDKVKVEALKERLATIKFDKVLVSEKIRTQQTAQAIGYAAFLIEPLLNELHFGEFEGKSKTSFIETIGKDWADNCLTLELGEKLTDFQQRLISFIGKYKTYPKVLVFGHGAVIRGLKAIQEKDNINQMNTYPSPNLELAILVF